MSRTAEGVYTVEDVIRGQWGPAERDRIILEAARCDRERHRGSLRTWFEQEPGSGGKESAFASVRLLDGFATAFEPVTGTKEVRADPFASQAQGGNVRLLRAPWNRAYLDELCSFPTGTHDDQVDASSGAFNKLATEGRNVVRRPTAERRRRLGFPAYV
jgi:predicted phage terminase large subunit-like protein